MALGAPFHCCRLTHWMPRLAAPTPLGLVLERQSFQAKDGFVESKKVSIVFCAELTAGDERAARLSPKREPRPSPRYGAPFRKFTGAPKVPHGNGLVGSGWAARRDEPDREGTLPGRAPHSKE